MNYGKIKPIDVANGEGIRVSLFVSGCPHKCKGCFNSELWDYDAGKPFTCGTVFEIMEHCSPNHINGLSLLGGEPLDPNNINTMDVLCSTFKRRYPHKDIWCYTGYEWENVKQLHIMKYIDVLVDGQFVEDLHDLQLRFRGSANQRIIDVQKSLKSGKICLRKDLME